MEINCRCPKFKFTPRPLPQGGVLPPQWGTFVPNQPILMKFGMSCPYSCGNGLLLSEIQIPPPFPHLGEGGGFVARGPEMYEDE